MAAARARALRPHLVIPLSIACVALLVVSGGLLSPSLSAAGTDSGGVPGGGPGSADLAVTNWAEFHQNPQLTAVDPGSNLTTANAATLGVRWATDLYGPALDSPVAAYDPALRQTLLYIGTETGSVLALNASTGQIVWGHWLGAIIRGTPVVSNGSVYVGTDTTPALYRLNAATGSLQCRLVVTMPIEGTPLIVHPPGGVPTLYVGTIDDGLRSGPVYAMNAATCALEWTFSGYHRMSGSWVPVSYAVDAHGEPLVVFGTADPDASVYALNALTGAEVWRFQAVNPPPGTYDIGAGATISVPGANGFADGVVYVPSKFGILYALDLTTGAQIWATDFNAVADATEGGRSTPACSGENLVFGYSGGVFDLNASSGAVRWQFVDPSRTEVLSSPAILGPAGHQIVVAADLSGRVDVLRLANGALLYSYATAGYITASPAAGVDDFWIASSDGFLYDFGPAGGNDATPPSTVLVSPQSATTLANPNGMLTVLGVATDSAGVAGVEVAVRSGGADGLWWDPARSTWSLGPAAGPAVLSRPGTGASNWSFSFPMPPGGGVFWITAYARSIHGQSDVLPPSVDVTVLAAIDRAHLQAASSFVAPGGSATLSGGHFARSEEIEFELNGAVLAVTNTTATGAVPRTRVPIPSTAAFGLSAIVGFQPRSHRSASVAITVANPWEQTGFGAGDTGFEPNDPTWMRHVYVGTSAWLYLAWHFAPGVPFLASPAVVGGVAYLASLSGDVYAIDIANGGLLWDSHLPSGAPVVRAPSVDPLQGLLFVAGTDGTLSALAISTGDPVWSIALGGNLSAPVFGAGKIYLTSDNGLVSVLETTGAVLWTAPLPSRSASSVALDPTRGILVDALASGELLAVHISTGQPLWSASLGAGFVAAPTLWNGAVVVGSLNSSVYAVSERTGARLWTFVTSGPIESAGVIVSQESYRGAPEYAVGSANGILWVLNVATGTLDFTVSWGAPIVGVGAADGIIFAETSNGFVKATRAYTSLTVWSHWIGSPLASAPVLVDGTVYVSTEEGNLYAFTTFGQPPI